MSCRRGPANNLGFKPRFPRGSCVVHKAIQSVQLSRIFLRFVWWSGYSVWIPLLRNQGVSSLGTARIQPPSPWALPRLRLMVAFWPGCASVSPYFCIGFALPPAWLQAGTVSASAGFNLVPACIRQSSFGYVRRLWSAPSTQANLS